MIIIILKNVSNSNPGLARIPMSFASSAITDYIRNLCLWCKMKYMLLMFIHLFSSWYFCSVCAGTSQGSSLSQSLRSQKENEPSPPSASETEVRPSLQVFRKFDQKWQKMFVKFRKSERDHESDWKSGAAKKVDQGSNPSDGNFVFFNQISKIKHTLHFKWLDMLKCLWWWYAKAGHISAAALGCTVIVFTVFVTCSRRVQPSCSRWICSALRRNGSWQA